MTWKGYAQDLGNQPGREDGLGGAPGTAANNPTTNAKSMTPSATDKANGITSFTGAQANDQYVAKHFPFPWFHSIIGDNNTGTDALTTPAGGSTDTDANHIANLTDPSKGLIADLGKPAERTTTGRVLSRRARQISRTLVGDVGVACGPGHQGVQVIGGPLLAQDRGVMFGGLAAHLPLQGDTHQGSTAGGPALSHGLVEEGHHLLG